MGMKLTMTIGTGPEQIVGLNLDAETINAIILLIRVARTTDQSIALHLNDGMMNRWPEKRTTSSVLSQLDDDVLSCNKCGKTTGCGCW